MTYPDLPTKPKNHAWIWLLLFGVTILLLARDLEINLQTLSWGIADMGEYLSRYRFPDFSAWREYSGLMLQTIATAWWGTVLAVVIGFLLAPLASRTLNRNRFLNAAAREILNALRAIPDLLLALIFVCSFGLGPLPGVLALGAHTGGFLGKFFAESLDRVPKGRYEAMAAVGASFGQTVMFAGWPSILREVVGFSLYIFDRNVRMSSVLGLVGAGGIGLKLHETLRLFNYSEAAALILMLIVTIFAIDLFSSWLRNRLHEK